MTQFRRKDRHPQNKTNERKKKMAKPKSTWRAYRHSNYLRKEDFPEPEDLKISDAQEEMVAAPGEEPEPQLVLYFEEKTKGMVCNPTNSETLENMTGSENPRDWIGTTVTVFNDPNVKFGSQRVGGLRLRVPMMRMKKPHKPVPMSQPRADAPEYYDEEEQCPTSEMAAAATQGKEIPF